MAMAASGRAVQAVGVGVLFFPVARAHGGDVLEQDGGRVVNRAGEGGEALWRHVVRVDDLGLEVLFGGHGTYSSQNR